MAIIHPMRSILWSVAFIFNSVLYANTDADKSCFSFIHTDESSSDTLENNCYEISSEIVNTRYKGIDIYIKTADPKHSSPCSSQDIQLETIQRYIVVNGTQEPRLCRTKFTVSINAKNCGENIKNIDYYCLKPESPFFHECASVDCSSIGKKEKEAIIMSGFPKPTFLDDKWGIYDIPTSHCGMRQCKLENCSTDEIKNISKIITVTTKPTGENLEECLFIAVGSGGGGLLLGILSTTVVCLLHNKCKRIYRNEGIMVFSKQNVKLSEIERKFSIHSKEGETVYHDIADVPGPSKAKTFLHDVGSVVYDDSPEQRYSESPKSSPSVNENESISSLLSAKSSKERLKESTRGDKPQFYHTLSRDYNDNSSNQTFHISGQKGSTGSKNDNTLESELVAESEQFSILESPVDESHIKLLRKVEPVSDVSADHVTQVEVVSDLPQLYHTLKGDQDNDTEEIKTEGEIENNPEKNNSSNGADSLKEYYVIRSTHTTDQDYSSSDS